MAVSRSLLWIVPLFLVCAVLFVVQVVLEVSELGQVPHAESLSFYPKKLVPLIHSLQEFAEDSQKEENNTNEIGLDVELEIDSSELDIAVDPTLITMKQAHEFNARLHSLISMEGNLTQWVDHHPYTEFLRYFDESDNQRYLIVYRFAGFGNTVMILTQMAQYALLTKRKILFVADENIPIFFDCPLGKGNCWISRSNSLINQSEATISVTALDCINFKEYDDVSSLSVV